SSSSARSRAPKSVPFSLGGWSTGTPARSASSFTGEAWMCCPRPRGRSGWVTTATTEPTARHARSEGTENSGVPKKARREATSGLLVRGVEAGALPGGQGGQGRGGVGIPGRQPSLERRQLLVLPPPDRVHRRVELGEELPQLVVVTERPPPRVAAVGEVAKLPPQHPHRPGDPMGHQERHQGQRRGHQQRHEEGEDEDGGLRPLQEGLRLGPQRLTRLVNREPHCPPERRTHAGPTACQTRDVLELEAAVHQDLAASVGVGAHGRQHRTLLSLREALLSLTVGRGIGVKPGGSVHLLEGRMGRTAAAVVLALSLSVLTIGCSKDPSTPAYWEAQLDQAQRPSEKV